MAVLNGFSGAMRCVTQRKTRHSSRQASLNTITSTRITPALVGILSFAMQTNIVCLSIRLSVCLIVCLARLSIRLSVNLPICLSAIVTESTCMSLEEKKGKGVLNRIYHWMEAKSIRPLSALAEVDTLEGSCTLSGHFFANCGIVGKILVKKLACLNCANCRQHDYHQCGNTAMCGAL